MSEKRKTSDAQRRAAAKWDATQKRYSLRMPHDTAAALEAAAAEAGQSINAYVMQAIRERMDASK